MSFTLVTCPSTCPLLMASVNPACTGALSCSTPEAKRLSFGKLTRLYLSKPGVQALPFTLVHHLEKVLSEAIGCRKSRMGLTQRRESRSFVLVQGVWMLHEKANRSPGGRVKHSLRSHNRVHLCCFEGREKAIDHALRAWVALGCDLLPEAGAVALPVPPAFEYIGSVGVKVALPFAPWPTIRGHPSSEPMTYRPFVNAKATGNLFGRETLLAQALGLLIACISLSAVDRNGPRDLRAFRWTPFFYRDRRLFLNVDIFSSARLSRHFHFGEHA